MAPWCRPTTGSHNYSSCLTLHCYFVLRSADYIFIIIYCRRICMRFIYSRTRTLTAKDMFDAMMDEACSRSMLMRHFCFWAPIPSPQPCNAMLLKSILFTWTCLAYKPYFFSQRIIFFSHTKSVNNTFSHGLSAK